MTIMLFLIKKMVHRYMADIISNTIVVNEGIEYPYNYLYGSVDGVTGKIYSFGSYWNENVEF